MSTVLYKLVNGKPESEMVEAIDVDRMLKGDYATDPNQLKKSKKKKVKKPEDE